MLFLNLLPGFGNVSGQTNHLDPLRGIKLSDKFPTQRSLRIINHRNGNLPHQLGGVNIGIQKRITQRHQSTENENTLIMKNDFQLHPANMYQIFQALKEIVFKFIHLWNIERVNQFTLQPNHEDERQNHENKQSNVAVPGINHPGPIQRLTQINQEVMSQRKKNAQSLNRTIHGQNRKCKSTNGERNDSPQTTHAQSHSQSRHQGKEQNTKSLRSQYHTQSQK